MMLFKLFGVASLSIQSSWALRLDAARRHLYFYVCLFSMILDSSDQSLYLNKPSSKDMSSNAPAFENVKYDTSLPVVDRGQMEMLVMSEDPEEVAGLAKELYDLFVSEADGKVSELASVCGSKDLAGLRKIVHFIAGSAGNLGLLQLSAFLRGLEHEVDAGAVQDFTLCGEIVQREYQTSCAAFVTEFNLS